MPEPEELAREIRDSKRLERRLARRLGEVLVRAEQTDCEIWLAAEAGCAAADDLADGEPTASRRAKLRGVIGDALRRLGDLCTELELQAARGAVAREDWATAGDEFAQIKTRHQVEQRPVAAQSTSPGTPGIEGYCPADWFWHEHGIKQARLSEAAGAGKVRTKPAPRGYLDTEGRAVRVLYNKADALKHCAPKHVTTRTRRKLGLGNS